MRQVWKCDFCSKTDKGSDLILNHEKTCSFNPTMKTCYTCKHKFYSGYDNIECEINLDVLDGEDIGNCKGWETSNIKKYRNFKLNKLNNVSNVTLEK